MSTGNRNKKIKKPGMSIAGKIFLVLLVILVIASGVGAYIFIRVFSVKNITFEGTDKYTGEQLKRYIFGEDENLNTIILSRKLKKEEKKTIPFIQTYEVTIDYPDSVHVELYDKAIVAYVIYKDNFMYFDKDGIVVESSTVLLDDVPLIEGLEFKSIVMNEVLPVKDKDIYNVILNISQDLYKYEVKVDKVHFNEDYSITLLMGNVRINLGTGANLSEKIYGLKQMESGLEGLSGVLYMENYDSNNDIVTFKKD